jgi:heme exporter protein D
MLWIAVGLGVLGVVVALVRTWQRRAQTEDMGAVSHQWISEQRLGQQGQDPRR